MEFTKKQNLKCIYCGESQQYPAIDAIPFIPNLFGPLKKEHQSGVHECQCNSCDQFFYVSLVDDKVVTANLPTKLYNRK